ncbi:MAG: primosomal protein N' [Bacteroidetes bacterium]|nr:primosomal protein N' [Bacteroidota bacterium]
MSDVKDLTLEEIQKILPGNSAWKVIQSLLEKGLISVYENLHENYQPKKERFVFLSAAFHNEEKLKLLFTELEKAPKQLNVLLVFLHLKQTQEMVQATDLLKQSNASAAQLSSLVDKGIFDIRKLEIDRLPFETPLDIIPNELNEIQQKALHEIQLGFKANKPVLLKGITGSGKTHIYFKLIEQCIAQGKQALYLLPEIALTPQIVRKLRSTFTQRIGIYHSRYSNNERVEIWHKTQHHQYDIIIGARSALFLPFSNLGLVIVDEEHDTSYKQQDPSPRYQARDCALYLAHQCKANIVLGSATPSLESFYNTEMNKFHLVELSTRYGEANLPAVQIVDTRQEIAEKKQQGIFSSKLITAIQSSLMANKQVILFQNRRGYSPFSMCSTCGWVPHCKYCDVSLTYHKLSDKLHCHYCGSKTSYIKICPACGGTRIVAKSFGTEKIEDDIKKIFPHARVQRFDWDAMRIKNKYAEIIRLFEKREIDILVGTQMVVKGLDFEHVNLVGVLSADSLLSYPDFRVNERGFQLLEQVAGRAGRKNDIGNVIVQLYNITHPVIRHIISHDYVSFYKEEMLSRKEFFYPPYTRLIKITLRHKVQDTVYFAAQKLAEEIKDLQGCMMYGPAEPPVARVRNQYLQEILLKVNKDHKIMVEMKQHLREKINRLSTQKNMSTVQIILDIDP